MIAPFFLGIDVGTQGARVVLVDANGTLVSQAEEIFPLSAQSMEEQSPQDWWSTCLQCIKAVIAQAGKQVLSEDIMAVSVTSTSGTVIPVDASNEPLYQAIMYSDKRSAAQGERCRKLAIQHNRQGYTGFNASSGLSKMVWFAETYPDKVKQIKYWVHAGDYILGKLSDSWGITDYTNALKSGYDLKRLQWPEFIFEQLPVKKETLPTVLPPGTMISHVSQTVANETGLSTATKVVIGMTDGCASQVASGAMKPGDWNTTIGTTLVIKGVTEKEIKDPKNRLYNHRHPDGFWMPGGAANIGAAWVTEKFKYSLPVLNEKASQLLPTGLYAYPLLQKGERFPFIAPEATGFYPEGVGDDRLYTACMEGVAYVERWGYDMIKQLSDEKVTAVYTAGGGSNSDAWLTIRASVLKLPVYKKKYTSGAIGAAILAASRTFYASLSEATQAMTQTEKQVDPQADLVKRYEDYYHQFVSLLESKQIITDHLYD